MCTLERGQQAPAGEASYPSAALGWLPGRSQLPRAVRAGLGKLPRWRQPGIEPHFSPWESVSFKSERGSDSEMSPNMETFAKGKEKFEPLLCLSVEQNDQEARVVGR